MRARLLDWLLTHAGGQLSRYPVPLTSVAGTEIMHRTPVVEVATPELCEAPLSKDAWHLRRSTYSVPSDFIAFSRTLFYCSRNNAYLSRSGSYIRESVNTTDSFAEHGALRRRSDLRTPVPLDGTIHPLRSRYNNHYHTLIDNLPRLLRLHDPACQAADEIWVVHAGPLTPVEQYFAPRLLPANAKLVQIEDGPLYLPTQSIIVPFRSRDNAGYLPSDCIAALRATVPYSSATKRRILISRSDAPAGVRRLVNQDELAAALAPFEVESVLLEGLDITEQSRLFSEAELVIGVHGAGLANIVFCRSAAVVELFPTDTLVPHYMLLARSAGLSYCRLHHTGHRFNSDFTADVGRIRSLVESLLRG